MNQRVVRKTILFTAIAISIASGLGCGAQLLDPDFLGALGLGERSASLPGDAPAVLIAVENRTGRVISAVVSYRAGTDRVSTSNYTVQPNGKVSEAFVCPISELTLGDVSNLDQIGAIVRLGNGGDTDPYIEVEAFGVLLKENQNYSCGDSITFTVSPSSDTRSGYRVIAYIQRAN